MTFDETFGEIRSLLETGQEEPLPEHFPFQNFSFPYSLRLYELLGGLNKEAATELRSYFESKIKVPLLYNASFADVLGDVPYHVSFFNRDQPTIQIQLPRQVESFIDSKLPWVDRGFPHLKSWVPLLSLMRPQKLFTTIENYGWLHREVPELMGSVEHLLLEGDYIEYICHYPMPSVTKLSVNRVYIQKLDNILANFPNLSSIHYKKLGILRIPLRSGVSVHCIEGES